ncbi:MAG: elongation factor G [Firmicutes bacterium]|nr:elongation factor G [Bacillota bacterium]
MSKYDINQVRNLALISHGGAGKTSLAEALLYVSKATNRLGKIETGNMVTDYDDEEIRKQITINTVPAPLDWKGHRINLLDTPGYFDFIGDVLGALRAADAALLVVCAVGGLEVGTEKMWNYAHENDLPRLIFINKLDRENANYFKVVEQLQNAYGNRVAPVTIPWGEETDLKGVIDLIGRKAISSSDMGRSSQEEEIPAEYVDKVEELREKLMELVAETDDDLLMKYLDGEPLTDDEIKDGLKKGTVSNTIVPILCGSSTMCMGIQTLLDFISDYMPSPEDSGSVTGQAPGKEEKIERRPSRDDPFSAIVFKTLADPYVGRINYFRVYSGVLKPDSQIFNSSKEKAERIGQVFFMRGKTQIPAEEIMAGDIGAVAKLQTTSTGDTLSDRNDPICYERIFFPEPVISFAVEPKTKGEEEKVSGGLARFLDEDPTFRLERKIETRQTVISGMGELQLENIVNNLQKKFGVEVVLSTPRVPFKETIKGHARTEAKHKKQSGGRGQYGHVYLEIEPDENDFTFEDKIFGGVVPKQYVPAVEKGIREAMEEGVLAGYPVVGIKVALVDGSYHTVDSSELAFKIAASVAFKKGFVEADPILLEPVMDVEVTVPEDFMGDIMGDLNGRRGKIQGMEPSNGMQMIRAQVPMAEMFRYAIDLRSMTQGRGFFLMKFSRYEEVPFQIAEKIIEAAREEKESE